MRTEARRPAVCRLHRLARRALLIACLWHGAALAASEIASASYAGPTQRYGHGVLGDDIEHTTLVVRFSSGLERSFVLPDHLVFEDTAPRLIDLDFDANPEAIVVESSQNEGARLAIYGPDGRIAATPFIGTRFRWLAPVGAVDLDRDGAIEIAFVDRPHLAKTLRIWRYRDGVLHPVADFSGVTNHRIGERDIAGGVRTCGETPEMIVASANWTELLAVRFTQAGFSITVLGDDTRRAAFARAMACAP